MQMKRTQTMAIPALALAAALVVLLWNSFMMMQPDRQTGFQPGFNTTAMSRANGVLIDKDLETVQ